MLAKINIPINIRETKIFFDFLLISYLQQMTPKIKANKLIINDCPYLKIGNFKNHKINEIVSNKKYQINFIRHFNFFFIRCKR